MPHLEELSSQLGKDLGMRQKSQFKALKLLLCNLFIQGQRKVMVSRKKQPLGGKRYNPLGIGYSSIISSLDALESNGYIVQELGDFDENKRTTMMPTDKLLQWFENTEWSDEGIDKRVGTYITLRKAKKDNGKQSYIDYEDTDYSKWLSEEIKQYDQLLSNSRIVLLNDDGTEDREFKKFTIQRKFIRHKHQGENTEFAYGGRMPGPWVNLSSELRKNITIDGQPTIELDRDASHLNAMYQVITGAPYPYDDDPYYIIVDGYPVPRHIAKNFSTFMQGSNSVLGTAHSVINHYKYEALKVKNPKAKDIKKHEEYIEFKKKVKSTDIAKAILSKHPKIAKYYNNGKIYGDFISCWESDIVFEVVMELTKREIPCLTIYDSFIVPIQYKELVDNMKDVTPYINRRVLSEEVFNIDNYNDN
ncbi:hypothetical protein W908_04495 [Candidatus Pseudothioglobus singularis PS1]|uniref:Uncharacterized protein n=2 Tax=Candidatus Pseudothioglobus TaxID=2841677 RepID=A0A0M4M1R0_9GAMM|nr:hypothetical protein W908_04495 [Candidatus Pseudothioglobus singularis PS1]